MFTKNVSSPEGVISSEGKKASKGRVMTAVVALAVPSAVIVSHVSAEQPQTSVDEFDRTFTSNCPQGFALTENYQGQETIRRFSDGTQKTFVHVESQLSNSVTGETLEAKASRVYTFDSGTLSVAGITLRIVEPGEGMQAIDTGRTVYNTSTGEILLDAGRSDTSINLCEILAE